MDRDRLYIGGEWVEPAGSETHEVIDATTEEVMGSVPLGSEEDVERAVEAARRGFEEWSQVPAVERAESLRAISQALAARSGAGPRRSSGPSEAWLVAGVTSAPRARRVERSERAMPANPA